MDYTNTPVHEPGSPKYTYWGVRGAWGSVEEQVKEAQSWLRENISSYLHKESPAYYQDCDHINPDDDEYYEDVDDLIEAWLAKNCNFDGSEAYKPMKSPEWQLYYKNWTRATKVVKKYAEWDRKLLEYEDNHPGNICMWSPAGTFCEGCQETDDFEFVEIGSCYRHQLRKQENDEFWYLFSEDNERLMK